MSPNAQNNLAKLIPIGRRIGEIMEAKGGAFTQRAFAPRVGLSKDTLGRIISGERAVMIQELDRIAKGLSISISRLKQEDTAQITKQLVKLLDTKGDPEKALVLAEHLDSVSIGVTEKCDTSLLLARSVYAFGDYDKAHRLLLESYSLAERIFEKYGETDRLYEILSKLMTTYAIRKEFSTLSDVLLKVEKVFEKSPDKQGAICFTKAMIAEHYNDVEQTRELLYRSLDCFETSGKKNDIGRAEMSVGYFEFKQRNYEVAKKYLRRAVVNLADDVFFRYRSVKELVKALILTNETSEAIHLLQEARANLNDQPDMRAKFAIMLSVATEDASYAESIIENKSVNEKILHLACKFLTKHFMKLGDAEAAMKYSIIADRYALSPSEILHEEDL